MSPSKLGFVGDTLHTKPYSSWRFHGNSVAAWFCIFIIAHHHHYLSFSVSSSKLPLFYLKQQHYVLSMINKAIYITER